MLGYSEFELLGMTFQDLTHPDDLARDMAYTEQLLRGERDLYRMQKRYFHRFGHTVYIQLDVSVLRGADCQPIHLISQIKYIPSIITTQEALPPHSLRAHPLRHTNRRAMYGWASGLMGVGERQI